jgi:phage repressor protein C with HTH and peptisase S24 domain
MRAQGLATKKMADYCGVTPGAVSNWFSTGRISKENLVLAAELLKVSTDSLISGDTADAGKSPGQAIELTNNPEYPAIRRVAIKAQAGVSGYAVEYMNDDGPPIVFRKDWYTMHKYQPEKMLALRVGGESMVPNLYPGDLIVANSAQTEPKDGIAFVVAYEGEVVVKRLIRDAGQWWLSSDNQDQRRYPRKVCNGDTQIIGEVVYRQTERI